MTAEQAFNVNVSSFYAAGMVSFNTSAMAAQHTNFTGEQALHAGLAVYNMGFVNRRTGRPNISGNPATIDRGTQPNGTYGASILAIQKNCF